MTDHVRWRAGLMETARVLCLSCWVAAFHLSSRAPVLRSCICVGKAQLEELRRHTLHAEEQVKLGKEKTERKKEAQKHAARLTQSLKCLMGLKALIWLKAKHPAEERDEEAPTEGDAEKTVPAAEHHVEMTAVSFAGHLTVGIETVLMEVRDRPVMGHHL